VPTLPLCSHNYMYIYWYIFNINSLYIARFMFCYHSQLLLPIFLDLFTRNNQIHNYNIRSATNYRTQTCRTITSKKFTILYQEPKIWNSLPTNIKESCTQRLYIVLRKLGWNFYSIIVPAAQMHYSCKLNIYYFLYFLYI
jgi:hypothetical protein